MNVKMMESQTINEFFSEKKGYDVILFGIVDKGLLKIVFNTATFTEGGGQHGSNTVASMMQHFFQHIVPALEV